MTFLIIIKMQTKNIIIKAKTTNLNQFTKFLLHAAHSKSKEVLTVLNQFHHLCPHVVFKGTHMLGHIYKCT